MITAVVIPADKEQPLYKTELDGLPAMQNVVGGFVEVLDVINPEASIWSNEEGAIIDLPQNARATILLWVGNMAHANYTLLRGDCFITGRPDSQGDTTSVPDELVKLLLETETYKFEVQTADSEVHWNSNQQRFDDPFQACIAGISLSQRWMAVTAIRLAAA